MSDVEMPNLSAFIGKNAFNILGLIASATNKEIRGRYKEILVQIEHDGFADYYNDSKAFTLKRTSELVNHAYQRLSNKNNLPEERFFWFNFTQETQQSYKLLNEGKHVELIALLRILKPSQDLDIFHKNKNIALLQTLMLTNNSNQYKIKECLNSWRAVVADNIGWKSLMHEYMQVDDLIDEKLFSSFREQIIDKLADIFISFAQQSGEIDYISEYQKVFGSSDAIYAKFTKPIIDELIDGIDSIKKLDVAADNVLDSSEKEHINNAINLLDRNFYILKSINYYDHPKVTAARDNIVERIRELALELNNKLREITWSIKLTKFSAKIASSNQLKSKIANDLMLLSIVKKLKELGDLDPTADGILDDDEIEIINSSIDFLRKNFGILKGAGIYESPTIKTLRDSAAVTIRSMAIDITNKLQEVGRAKKLIIFAQVIVADEKIKARLDKDLLDITSVEVNIKQSSPELTFLGEIFELVKVWLSLAIVGFILISCISLFSG